MLFKEMVLKTIEHTETRENIISDCKSHCYYRELPEIFSTLDQYFREKQIDPQQSLSLVCGNTLPEAVMLLWMLYNQANIIIIPRGGVAFTQPEFSQYIVSAKINSPTLDIKSPSTYLNLETNPEHQASALSPGKKGSIFLRTSGSTAEPKLVLHDHTKFAQNTLNCVDRFRITPQDRVLIPVPIYHMYGLGAAILPSVIAGANISLMEHTNIIRYLDRERQFKPTAAFLTPVLMEMQLQTRKSSYPYRLIVTAGDRINRETFVNFENRFGMVVNLYGSTELGAIATSNPETPLTHRAEGIVEPLPGVTVNIASENESDKTAAVSEIICTHDSGFDTYIDKKGQKITSETARPFATKDLGKIISNQQFRVVGRIGNSMNRNGILVAYSEVETLIELGIPSIAHVVVTSGKEDNSRGKQMIAWSQLKPNQETLPEEIRSQCFELMPRHMVPDKINILSQLPRLPNGKFDRKTLSTEME